MTEISDRKSAIEPKLLKMWREALGLPTITLDDDVLKLGATSLHMMSIISQIADEYAVDIPVEALFDAITISDQVETLNGALG
jgi:acyl carrier protein